MKVGSLFSGIGGFDLGLERAGMEVVWQVENEPYCQRVLEKHWPDVKRYGDIKELDPHDLESVDLICAGFPCQPVSYAGKRLAQDDSRWLWPEVDRFVRVLRPRFVVLENVPGLLSAGMSDVLGDLAACGYDAEWDCIPAAAVGAPHLRYRVWIVAYANGQRVQRDGMHAATCKPVPGAGTAGGGRVFCRTGCEDDLADSGSGDGRARRPGGPEHGGQGIREQTHEPAAMADPQEFGERPGLCQGEPGAERGRRPGDGSCTGAGGRLNPTWVEWLMGFPLGWTDLEDSATP